MLNGVKLEWIKDLLTSAHECTKHFLLRSRIYFQKFPSQIRSSKDLSMIYSNALTSYEMFATQ